MTNQMVTLVYDLSSEQLFVHPLCRIFLGVDSLGAMQFVKQYWHHDEELEQVSRMSLKEQQPFRDNFLAERL
jgi:hypothetical protein